MVQALSAATRGGNSSSIFRSHRNTQEGTSAAQKSCHFFPGYYFLMMSSILRCRGSNLSALEPLSRMDRERRALLDHAALCRRVAGEISHPNAAKRLRMMAQEYETRALRLEGVTREAEDDVGASSEMFKTEQTP